MKNKSSPASFFAEFRTLPEVLSTYPGNLIITGDFNFHVDVPRLLDNLESHGLSQLTALPTHKAGHILDWVIAHSDVKLVAEISISHPGLPDHTTVLFILSLPKLTHLAKPISFRRLKTINTVTFLDDLSTSSIVANPPLTLAELTQADNSSLIAIQQDHAPLCSDTITVRSECEWFNDEPLTTKRNVRRLERLKKHSGLPVYAHMFDSALNNLAPTYIKSLLTVYTTL